MRSYVQPSQPSVVEQTVQHCAKPPEAVWDQPLSPLFHPPGITVPTARCMFFDAHSALRKWFMKFLWLGSKCNVKATGETAKQSREQWVGACAKAHPNFRRIGTPARAERVARGLHIDAYAQTNLSRRFRSNKMAANGTHRAHRLLAVRACKGRAAVRELLDVGCMHEIHVIRREIGAKILGK